LDNVTTASNELIFSEARDLGSRLIWLHTYGERFHRADFGPRVPHVEGLGWNTPITAIPEGPADISYDEEQQTITIGDGSITGVQPEVWNFSVSQWKVVQKWIGQRTRTGIGRAASRPQPLDMIRPTAWEDQWNDELLDLLRVLTVTLDLHDNQVALFERIVTSDIFVRSDLPDPTADQQSEPTRPRPSNPTLI